jgi:hypothetical protein
MKLKYSLMKKFTSSKNIPAGESACTLPVLCILLFTVFSLATSAQAQQPAGQKAPGKEEFTPIPPASQQEPKADPAVKKEVPLIKEAVINVKDEQQYLEQKKQQQQHSDIKKEVNAPK